MVMAKYELTNVDKTKDPELFTTPRYARFMTGKERDEHTRGFEDTIVKIFGKNSPSRDSVGKWIDYVCEYRNYEETYTYHSDYEYRIELMISEHSKVTLLNEDIDLSVDGHYINHGIYVNIYGTVYTLPVTANIEDVVKVAFALDSIHSQLAKKPYGEAVLSSDFKDRKKFEKGLEDIKNGNFNSWEMPWGAGTYSEQLDAIALATKHGLMKNDIIPKETDKKHYTKDLNKFLKLLPELVEKYAPTHEKHLQEQQAKDNGDSLEQ